MFIKELDAAIAAMRQLQASRSMSAHAKEVNDALHELVALRKGGKVQERRVVRVIAMVSKIVAEAVATGVEK